MKKMFYPCMALIAMLSMASCSSDDVAADLGGEELTVTLRLPSGLESKATFGDQTTVTLDELKYTVFEGTKENAKTAAFSGEKENPFAGGTYQENVTIKLGKGKDYTIVFYADKKDNGFVTFENGNISVNYDALSSNNEDYDAFYSVVEVPNGKTSVSTTLTRPFSQLNWGTDDLKEGAVTSKLDGLTATVKVTNGLYTGMNLLEQKVIASTAVTDAVTFDATAVAAPTQENTPNFPVTGYDLLAMNYLLTGEGTIDCELAFSNGFSPVTVNAAPVNTNYRTNIYGSLLTNPVNFNITVDKSFAGENGYDYNGNKIVNNINVKEGDDLNEILLQKGDKNALNILTLPVGTFFFNFEYKSEYNIKFSGESSQSSTLQLSGYINSINETVEFENLTVVSPNAVADNEYFFCNSIKADKCVFSGYPLGIQATTLNFTDCTFNPSENNFPCDVMLLTGSSTTEIYFSDCTFYVSGTEEYENKGAAIMLAMDGTNKSTFTPIVIEGCSFYGTELNSMVGDGEASVIYSSALIPFNIYFNNCRKDGFSGWYEFEPSTSKADVWLDGTQIDK